MILEWDEEKNRLLKEERGVCFEDVIVAFNENKILDVIKHPGKKKYPNQKIYIVEIDNYAYAVPFVRDKDKIFLKTIIPSRKLTKKYLRGD